MIDNNNIMMKIKYFDIKKILSLGQKVWGYKYIPGINKILYR